MTDTTTKPDPAGGIARLGAIVIDCREPQALADFYSAVSGWPLSAGSEASWADLESPAGGPSLSFQRVDGEYRPPAWPGTDQPQQFHLDFMVPDLDEGERRVLELGATKHDVQPGTSFRVYLDPQGHPFCLCQD